MPILDHTERQHIQNLCTLNEDMSLVYTHVRTHPYLLKHKQTGKIFVVSENVYVLLVNMVIVCHSYHTSCLVTAHCDQCAEFCTVLIFPIIIPQFHVMTKG